MRIVDLTAIFAALANPKRRRILASLREPERHYQPNPGIDMREMGVCVSQVSAHLGVSAATASQFLAQLRDVGLLTSQRIGKFTYYQRNDQQVQAVADAVQSSI
ncbi:ArsR/SmtB family transcription factor [Brevibacterium aurantiacum]|uniref:ArsR/SmtB family transcription factor n=1 Tax=Brevibacterium aurantiacum TaxID=273384 RepID=UPI0018681852|nr:metalloregulator ArsR/SmtB family transcription factor [Brevibacterium aurantiacum]